MFGIYWPKQFGPSPPDERAERELTGGGALPFGLTEMEIREECDMGRLNELVNGRLKAFRFSSWNQGGRDFEGHGVCMGMCLDWVRRILTGKAQGEGRLHYVPGKLFSAVYVPGEEPKKQESRFKKVEATNRVYRDAQRAALSKMTGDYDVEADPELLRRLKRRVPEVRDAIDFAQAFKMITSVSDFSRSFDIQRLLDGLKKELTREHVFAERSRIQATIFANFQAMWSDQLKKGPSLMEFRFSSVERTHSFKTIRIFRTGPTILCHTGPLPAEAFLNYVDQQGSWMRDGNCAILTVGNDDGGGHDMALYVAKEMNRIYYFDPNIGESAFLETDQKDLGLLLWATWRAIFEPRGYNYASWTEYSSA